MTSRSRTWILLAGLSALFVAVGGLVGGTGGIVVFLAIAIVFNFAMFWFSDRIALKMSRARPLEAGQMPDLVADVEDLSARARIPVPRLYVIPSQQPNAFATGRNPQHSAVAVTEGLVALMPRDQVRGVLAHELSHIRNRDVLVTTIAAMIGAAISAIANFLQFQWLFGGDDDESPLGFIGTIAAILIAPIAAMLLQFAISRQREFLADATAAELLGTGRPLADALGTLERGVEALPMQVNPATASLYIANPLSGGGMAALFSTHPPIPVRIAALRALDAARGASRRYGSEDVRAMGAEIRADGGDAGGPVRAARPRPLVVRGELPERERTKHVHRLHPYLGSSSRSSSRRCSSATSPGGTRARPVRGSGTTLVQALESGTDATGSTSPAFNCLLMR
jgi:heat shock protein HtpX